MDEIPAQLTRLRASIDNLDNALVCLLAERFKITQEVGVLKAKHGLPPADPRREEHQIGRLRTLAVSAGLDPEFAEKFLTFIVTEVVRHHQLIARSRPEGDAGYAGDQQPPRRPATPSGNGTGPADRPAGR